MPFRHNSNGAIRRARMKAYGSGDWSKVRDLLQAERDAAHADYLERANAMAVEKRNVYGRDRFCCRGLITEGEYWAIHAELGVTGNLKKEHMERAGYVLVGTRWTPYGDVDALTRDLVANDGAAPF